MSEAPERIWIDLDHWIEGPALSDLASQGYTEYVRADRIKELEAKLATCEKYRDAYAECDRIGTQAVRDLEAKLAKAVDALEFYADRDYVGYDVSLEDYGLSIIVGEIIKDSGETARATLAELTGGKNE